MVAIAYLRGTVRERKKYNLQKNQAFIIRLLREWSAGDSKLQ